jgi:chromosome segregation ATPase
LHSSPINQSDNPKSERGYKLNSLNANLKEKLDVWSRIKSKIKQNLVELQGGMSEYEEIEHHFKSKVVDVGQTEVFIKDEIKRIKERLAVIFVYREREKKMSLRNRKIWLASIVKLEQEIADLNQTQKDLEIQIQQIRQDAGDLHSLEMKKFSDVLYDSEQALEKIENERKRDEERLDQCLKDLASIKAEHQSKIDDRTLKEQMLHETKDRIRELEFDIETYEKGNPYIIEKYKSKANIEKELKSLKVKIDQMQLEVDEINQDRIQRQMAIDSGHKEIDTQKTKISEIGKNIGSLESEGEDHIKRIEVYFNRKRRETGMDSPHIFVRDYIKRLETMTIADEISIKDGEVLAKLKNSLLHNVSRTIEVLNDQISEKAADVKHVAETLKQQSKHHNKNNEHSEKLRQTLVLKFKTLVSEFRDLKIKKFKTELRLKHRKTAIEKYVSDQKILKPDLERTIYYNLKYLPSDDEVANYIIEEQNRKPVCVTPEENLEEVINNFYNLVRDREQKIQSCCEKRSNCNFIIRENQEVIDELSQTSDDMYYQRKAELTDLKVKVSKLQRQLEEVTANLEIEILDIGDKNFGTYYKKSLANTARKMQKVYGPRCVNQFKGKHKRDITDATYMTQHRNIHNYQAALDLLEESKIQIEKLQDDLKNVMPKTIHQLELDIKKQDDKIRKINVQYTAVVDAEKQLQRHIRNAIDNKEDDIKRKSSKMYIDTKFTTLEGRMVDLKQEINVKQIELSTLANKNVVVNDAISQSEGDEQDNIYYEVINQELIDEDIELRKRLDALKEAKSKLKNEINPDLMHMQDDRQNMEGDLEVLKAKIESMYDRY